MTPKGTLFKGPSVSQFNCPVTNEPKLLSLVINSKFLCSRITHCGISLLGFSLALLFVSHSPVCLPLFISSVLKYGERVSRIFILDNQVFLSL